jgi:hypothetical protein
MSDVKWNEGYHDALDGWPQQQYEADYISGWNAGLKERLRRQNEEWRLRKREEDEEARRQEVLSQEREEEDRRNDERDTGGNYNTPYNVDIGTLTSAALEAYMIKVRARPEYIRRVLLGFSTAEFIQERLGPKFGLTEEQKREITRIIRDILLGEIPLKSFIGMTMQKLRIDDQGAKKMADMLVSRLLPGGFEDIRAQPDR